jgi:hypothetical protein
VVLARGAGRGVGLTLDAARSEPREAPSVLSAAGMALISFSLLSRRRDHSAPSPFSSMRSLRCGAPPRARARSASSPPTTSLATRVAAVGWPPLASPLLTICRYRCSASLPGRRRWPLPVPLTTTSSMP